MHVSAQRYLISASAVALLLGVVKSPSAALVAVALAALGYVALYLRDDGRPGKSPVPPTDAPQTIEPLPDHAEPVAFHHPGPDVFTEPLDRPAHRYEHDADAEPSYGAIPRWRKPGATVAERVAEIIAKQMAQLGALFGSKCRDVLLSDDQARLVTTANSAINRHGSLIEDTILKTLEACERYRVWKSRKLATDEASDDEGGHRKMDVDLVVFDTETHCVTGYEVKRNGANAQDVARKLNAALPLLIREAEANGFTAIKADVAVISYYGGLHVHGFEVVTRETIDERFGVAIRAEVESATAKLRDALQGVLTHAGNDRRAA